MAKPYDTRLIMMVAQQPFETDMNQFCKLIPVIYVDGTRAIAEDFINDNEIWWMLTAQTAQLAEPGRLVVGLVGDATGYDAQDPSSSQYQVQRESVHDLELKDGVEVIELPGSAIDNIHDLVSANYSIDLPNRPALSVMLHWRSHVYGPFTTAPAVQGRANEERQFSFAPADRSMTIYQVDEHEFYDIPKDYRYTFTDEVSSSTHRRRLERSQCIKVSHDLVLAPGLKQVLAKNPEKLVLEPLERMLLRLVRQYVTRKKRQELQRLLHEIDLTGRETQEATKFIEVIGRVKRITENQEAALDAVTKALVESGMLGESRLGKAEQRAAEQYVHEKTAALQAQIEKSLSAKREELRHVETNLKDVTLRLQKEETQRRAILEKAIEAERNKSQKAMAAEREEFEKQKTKLGRQQELIKKNLEQATKELRESGDDVVNRFLTIAPLLSSMGMASSQRPQNDALDNIVEATHVVTAPFKIPEFITHNLHTEEVEDVSEEEFFTRFAQVVSDNGFTYDQFDLKRFHLSVKCGDLTVLGGPSGTGKSSLPTLYMQALLGSEAENGRPGCLMVNINPSWMDIRDLIGHMNTLEGRFYPAESGLFQYLVYAQEEYKKHGTATGLYPICLDEMNLSQVEHYFSDFMMVLEREGQSRSIRCFSRDVVRTSCPFRLWDKILLSPAVKFVGTVNFDETTRLLSDRFLDRVNLITLASGSLPSVDGVVGGQFSKAPGRMVTLADFERWRTDSALPADLGELLDRMRPLLTQIGCSLSPRVYRGICRFVSSASPLLTTTQAFDMQIAQRVVPKIRSLVTKRQFEALDDLLECLNESATYPFDKTVPLLEEIRESAGTRGWDLEE